MIKGKIRSAAMWSTLEAVSSAVLSIISIVFLARILHPEDYGQIATAQLIAGILRMILSLGLTDAIIQKDNLTDNHKLTVFWGSVGLSIIGFVISIFIAIYLYFTYSNVNIAIILMFETMGTLLAIWCSLPIGLLLKNLEMSAFTKRTLASRIVFFFVAIPMALNNFGLWSVVWANFIQVLVSTILIFHSARKLMPRGFYFNYGEFKEFASFGTFVMLENLLWNILSRVFSLLIVTFHGLYALGLFNMASRLTDAVLNILNTSISRMALPVFSSVQNDRTALKKAFEKATALFNFVSMPAFVGIALTCQDWVPLILGPGWTNAVPIIQIISLMNAAMFSRMFVGIAMKAVGESKTFMYLTGASAVTAVLTALATYQLSLLNTMTAWSIMRVVVTIPLGIYLLKKLIGISTYDQLSPVMFPLIGSGMMWIVVFFARPYILSLHNFNIINIILEILVGVIAYMAVTIPFFKKRIIA